MVPANEPSSVIGGRERRRLRVDRLPGRCRVSRQAEVQDLGAGRRQDHVAGLEVAMDDPAPVSRLDRLGDLAPDLQNLRDRQRTLSQAALHGLSVEVLHDQVVDSALGAHVVERADVGMLKLGDLLGFALETFLESRVARSTRRAAP